MANVLEKLLGVLDTQTIQDFISGKKSPKIDVDTNVTVETETVKTIGLYLFLAFSCSFLVLAFLMYFAMKWAISSAFSNR